CQRPVAPGLARLPAPDGRTTPDTGRPRCGPRRPPAGRTLGAVLLTPHADRSVALAAPAGKVAGAPRRPAGRRPDCPGRHLRHPLSPAPGQLRCCATKSWLVGQDSRPASADAADGGRSLSAPGRLARLAQPVAAARSPCCWRIDRGLR